MNKIKYEEFLNIVKPKKEELREDLSNLPIIEYKKVGDFGCGWGYFTWCLKHEIPDSECIGIDIFDPNNPPNFSDIINKSIFTLDRVKNLFIEYAEESLDFRKGNIITGENLPSDFDFIYCKRVLLNIFGGIENKEDYLKQTIHNIGNAIKYNGWLCLIEVQEPRFNKILDEYLNQANFEFDTPRCVNRLYETPCGNKEYPYLIYQCKKGKD